MKKTDFSFVGWFQAISMFTALIWLLVASLLFANDGNFVFEDGSLHLSDD